MNNILVNTRRRSIGGNSENNSASIFRQVARWLCSRPQILILQTVCLPYIRGSLSYMLIILKDEDSLCRDISAAAAVRFTPKPAWMGFVKFCAAMIKLNPRIISSYSKGLPDGWCFVHTDWFMSQRGYILY